MSDNVAITPGSGATVAADLIGGALYQRIKPTFGVDGSATDVSSSNGLPVNVVAGSLTLTGEDHIGEVGGNTPLIRVAPTISTTQYAALDVVGGIITIANAMRISGGSGALQMLTIIDTDNEKAAFTVSIYDASPSGGTYTDNSPFAPSAADDGHFIGEFPVQTIDYVTRVASTSAVATIRNIGMPVEANGSRDLFAIFQAVGAPTYASAANLKFVWGFFDD